MHATGTGFVLRTWPLRDSDLIVSLFTLEEGILAHKELSRAPPPQARIQVIAHDDAPPFGSIIFDLQVSFSVEP